MWKTGEDRLKRWILIGFFGVVFMLQLCGADDQALKDLDKAKNDGERIEGYRKMKSERK